MAAEGKLTGNFNLSGRVIIKQKILYYEKYIFISKTSVAL